MLTNEEIETEAGPIPAGALSITLGRSIDGGLHDITNYGLRKVRLNLEIVIRSDSADIFEIKSGEIVRRGRVTTDSVPISHIPNTELPLSAAGRKRIQAADSTPEGPSRQNGPRQSQPPSNPRQVPPAL